MTSLLVALPALLGAPAFLLAPQGGGERPWLESEAVLAYEIPNHARLSREHFALLVEGEPIGVAHLTFGPSEPIPSVDDSRLVAQLWLDLWPIRTRVHHVEVVTPSGPRLVWRELRERSGRTVRLEWGRDGETLVGVDWSGGDVLRRESPAPGGALLPLFLVSRVRAGTFPSGRLDVLDPTAGGVEQVEVETHRRPWVCGPVTVTHLALRRRDGSRSAEYLFLGSRLIAFRLQEGGPLAVRIPSGRYDALRAAEAERREGKRALEAAAHASD